MAYDIQCIAPAGDVCGEGAVWCESDASVYWTDINRFLIHRLNTETNAVESWHFEEPVVALSLTTEDGRFLVALGSKLIWWWPATDRRDDHGFVLPGAPEVRLNDGRADPEGNFWIGSMKNNVLPDGEAGEAGGKDGVLYRIAPDGSESIHLHCLGISNTLCWSPDGGVFYTADTLANEIYSFDVTDDGIKNRRIFFGADERGLPDGSAMDSNGDLWNCRFFGGAILRISADGTLRDVIEMPVRNITTATFGGPDRKTLYVTSASALRNPGDRLAGSLWAIRTDVAGLAENSVRIA
ncbi:MAG: SMP-30/gluconolactonase/LRE family protein [Rhodobacteraceae bacterium]|nr:SMP-30/gluconolactonase/LRE family protein [Paracoccaceae bacterium]